MISHVPGSRKQDGTAKAGRSDLVEPPAAADNIKVMSARMPRLVCLALTTSTLTLAACAGRTPPRVSPPVASPAAAVVRTAESLVGAPYRDGGADPSGFDCSGFVQYVLGQHGIAVPRDVRRQWQSGREVTRDNIRAGDLLFFTTTGPGPTHVTLALDRERFIHAPSSRGVVRVESLSSGYWSRRFVGARRLTP